MTKEEAKQAIKEKLVELVDDGKSIDELRAWLMGENEGGDIDEYQKLIRDKQLRGELELSYLIERN